MEAISLLLLLYILMYAGFILGLIYGFSKIKTFASQDSKPQTTFSIIIPFRNEEQNLPGLLASFSKLNYPKALFELLFIDDFSDDFSVNVIQSWRMQNGKFQTTVLENLRLSNSPKKDAITRAIPIITNEWIVTTDADCLVDKNWLMTLNAYIQNTNNVAMVVGAVAYNRRNSFLDRFQQMDLMSLQGATIGSFGLQKGFMCNGANFAYTKPFFQQLNGFKGNDTIASGDDVFLLQKAVAQHPELVHYLKAPSHIICTKPVVNWKALFHQRVRWASKTTSYQSDFGEDLALMVFIGNVCIVVSFVLWITGLIPFYHLLGLFLIKFIVDMVLLIQTNRFLYQSRFFFPLFSSLLYPFFSVSVAVYSLFGKYEWKGRKF